MMWEEHPEYQKLQARLIGWGLAGWVVFGVVAAMLDGDWTTLDEIMLYVGAFAAAFGLLAGMAWVLVRLLTGKGDRGLKPPAAGLGEVL